MSSSSREGALFVVSAPSGAGKTSLCRELIDRFADLRHSVSFTTRPPRDGEIDGTDYHFVAPQIFQQMVVGQQFAEWAEVHGNCYGTSRDTLLTAADQGIDLLLDIDYQGAAQLRKNYQNGVFVFILPPDFAELEKRLRGRDTDTEEVINQRLKNAVREISEAGWYDYLVINDDFSTALEELSAIVTAERCRSQRNRSILANLTIKGET